MTMNEQTKDVTYRVTKKDGWSYVIGDPMPEHSGPWRYELDAQDYADELNAKGTGPAP